MSIRSCGEYIKWDCNKQKTDKQKTPKTKRCQNPDPTERTFNLWVMSTIRTDNVETKGERKWKNNNTIST
jgi:hypothetical protein